MGFSSTRKRRYPIPVLVDIEVKVSGRTILITTELMEEADEVADVISIIDEGELQCAGSSYFLKKKYGVGYHLILNIEPKCNSENITFALRQYFPNQQVIWRLYEPFVMVGVSRFTSTKIRN